MKTELSNSLTSRQRKSFEQIAYKVVTVVGNLPTYEYYLSEKLKNPRIFIRSLSKYCFWGNVNFTHNLKSFTICRINPSFNTIGWDVNHNVILWLSSVWNNIFFVLFAIFYCIWLAIGLCSVSINDSSHLDAMYWKTFFEQQNPRHKFDVYTW